MIKGLDSTSTGDILSIKFHPKPVEESTKKVKHVHSGVGFILSFSDVKKEKRLTK